MRRITLAALLLSVGMGTAQAAPAGQDLYVLVGTGLARLDLGDRQELARQAVYNFETQPPGGTGETSGSDTGPVLGVALGYRIGPHAAVEAGFRNFGEMDTGYTLGTGPSATVADMRYRAGGFGVAALGFLPLSPAWRAYARVDAVSLRTSTEETYGNGGGTLLYSRDHAALRTGIGLGAEVDVGGGLALRVDARRMTAEFDTRSGVERRPLGSVNLSLLKNF